MRYKLTECLSSRNRNLLSCIGWNSRNIFLNFWFSKKHGCPSRSKLLARPRLFGPTARTYSDSHVQKYYFFCVFFWFLALPLKLTFPFSAHWTRLFKSLSKDNHQLCHQMSCDMPRDVIILSQDVITWYVVMRICHFSLNVKKWSKVGQTIQRDIFKWPMRIKMGGFESNWTVFGIHIWRPFNFAQDHPFCIKNSHLAPPNFHSPESYNFIFTLDRPNY